jgi:hypothetical protein
MLLDPSVKEWVDLADRILEMAVLLGAASLIRAIRRLIHAAHDHDEVHGVLYVKGIRKLFQRTD